ncbi:MAG: ApaLI family restriction endonuclease [Chloroflexota bacterium]|nr:ApaLI family restriction endonuclease [Chloroflexota bacterium]
MPSLDKQTRQLINAARLLGSGPLSIFLEDATLIRLCAIVAGDLDQPTLVAPIADPDEWAAGYYHIPLQWFNQPVAATVTLTDVFLSLQGHVEDFATYFRGLCELHKRRVKFQRILEQQPIPRLATVIPRSLLEFGLRPPEALTSWLIWRKWLYDVDNRSAQETGYLFEPILAAAIGGVPYAAGRSPVRRLGETERGRQVDCLDGRDAYEFKMRVTLAASGQGRFQEELSFARDCQASGYVSILLVLDPTPSLRLDDLAAVYQQYGGTAYIGDDAWAHIASKAGRVMGLFVEKYIHTPLREVSSTHPALQPLRLVQTESAIQIEIGTQQFVLSRSGPTLDFTEHEISELESL